jgi:hypothetical protein
MTYLAIYIVSARSFKCSLDNAKRSFHRSLNAVFGKIGRIASEEVTLHLLTSKCLPVLLYGLEACHMTKSDVRSMDFMFNRFLMRLFKTNKMEIVLDCANYFNIKLPSSLLNTRSERFLATAFVKIFSAVCLQRVDITFHCPSLVVHFANLLRC